MKVERRKIMSFLSKILSLAASSATEGVPGSSACIMFLWGDVKCPKELL